MDAASAIVQTDSMAHNCQVAERRRKSDDCPCLPDGTIRHPVASPFNIWCRNMPGMLLPPSSPVSIEPISMRVPDACRFTGISRSKLYLLIARGEVEVVKLGAATLVLTASLHALIEQARQQR